MILFWASGGGEDTPPAGEPSEVTASEARASAPTPDPTIQYREVVRLDEPIRRGIHRQLAIAHRSTVGAMGRKSAVGRSFGAMADALFEREKQIQAAAHNIEPDDVDQIWLEGQAKGW